MTEIFISYAREDQERVTPIVAALERQGWNVFWDRTIPIGQTWRGYIGDALESASCVVVAWSRYSVESSWVHQEADEAKNRNVYVPLLLDSVIPPFGLRETQAADLTSWNRSESDPQFVLLCNAITSLVSQKKSTGGLEADSTATIRREARSSEGSGKSGAGTSGWYQVMDNRRKLMQIGLPVIAVVVLLFMFFTRESDDRISRESFKEDQIIPDRDMTIDDERINKVVEEAVSDLDMKTEQEINKAIQQGMHNPDIQTGQVIPKNTSQQDGTGRWNWTIYLDASQSTLSKIQCVEYTLHSTFPDPVRTVCDPTSGFALSTNGWGTFEVKIKIIYKDGRTKNLTHMLKFN